MKLKILVSLAFILLHFYGKTQNYVDSLELQLPIANKQEKVEILKELAIEYYLISDYPQALGYFEEGIELAKETGDNKRLAVLYYNRALLYNDVTDYEKAIKNGQEGLTLFEQVGNDIGEAAANNLLGAILAEQGSFELALYYFRACKTLNEAIDYEQGIASSLLNMGNIHYDQQQADSAFFYYQQALETLKDTTEVEVRTVLLLNLGKIYNDKGALNLALNYFNQAIDIGNDAGNKYLIIEPLLQKGAIFLEQNKLKEAETLCLQAMSSAQSIDARDLLLKSYKVLTNLYEKQGDFNRANNYLKAQIDLSAELTEESRQQSLLETNAKFRVAKKEQENDLLRQKQAWQWFWIRTLIAGLLLLTTGLIIVVLQKIQQGKLYETLVKKNLEVVHSEQELTKINQQLNNALANKKTPKVMSKYVDSSLSETKRKETIEQLGKVMQEDQLYLQSTLTLKGLADHLNTNRTYLSQIINQEFGVSFSTYLNEYRIREARQMLSDADLNLSIQGVAQTVGFNSVPSFNAAFKKFTGVTPSFYMKSAH